MPLYQVTPVPKPRMTRRDKWLDPPRPPVARYRAFCWECSIKKVRLKPSGCRVTFFLPMPDSWSAKKKRLTNGMPHLQTPDLDNLGKAICDALFHNDSMIWDIHFTKLWGDVGKIVIEEDT